MTTATRPHPDGSDREHRALDLLRERLLAAYRDRHSSARITAALDRAVARFDRAPVRDFVPLLAERAARAELRASPAASPPAAVHGPHTHDPGACGPA
ncbi:three-helix bundle dimerization domain-containing protein [Planomonospora corallina]|uniref:Three-helix bundle dimerization domain-containing protein n=1 Tax=Planomonospora corallina TaxID=1806052 RepID=A0ABV8IM42_9ACTN